ncbi:tyrosine-type recombinase/integrase [Primorskyibacter sp. S87]|uniref:tyrosine-type recombinase/integrase n=1 Tax=Primorskyibacter sp. S87 TaxID=3415126 RepID=UPI003C7C4121
MAERIPLVLKFNDWPQADKIAWDALFAPGDIFDDLGPCAHWSEGSRKKREQGYGQWLSFVRRTDPKAFNETPAIRVTEVRASAFVEECEARLRPASTNGLISDLFVVVRAMSPDADWNWLATASKRFHGKANRKNLPPPHPVGAGEILSRCLDHMQKVERSDHLAPLTRSIRYRQALMIAFLICRPVRRRALLGMTKNQHLKVTPEGFHLHFAASDMKDRRARDFSMPKMLIAPMRHYLDVHRPVLLQGKITDSLWINQYGDSITADGLSRELPKVTKRLLGVGLGPHAFRHIAATTIAETDPEHVNIIRDILGHSTLDMAEKHYNRATGISACNEFQAIVEGICKSR